MPGLEPGSGRDDEVNPTRFFLRELMINRGHRLAVDNYAARLG